MSRVDINGKKLKTFRLNPLNDASFTLGTLLIIESIHHSIAIDLLNLLVLRVEVGLDAFDLGVHPQDGPMEEQP